VIFIVAIFVTAFGPERRGVVFGEAAERPQL
jgi:hypothetical protein